MKRIISIICCLMLAFSMSACGSEKTKQQPQENLTDTEIVKTEESDVQENADSTEVSADLQGEDRSKEMNPQEKEKQKEEQEEDKVTKMMVQVGNKTFSATLEDNQAVSELVQMLREAPITIEMSDYSGFEKVGGLGTSLTTSNSQTTTQAGDIVLYNGNQIVIFYGSNSWSYTRLGRIDVLLGWADALGNGDVTVTISIE